MEITEQKICTECNAPFIDGLSCWETLGLLISWEYDDPALLKEHFLTVASYNIQHSSKFVDEVIDELCSLHYKYIHNEVSTNEIRETVGKLAEGEKRVLKPESARVIIPKKWKMTIADVYIPNKREHAAERVRAWAKSIHQN